MNPFMPGRVMWPPMQWPVPKLPQAGPIKPLIGTPMGPPSASSKPADIRAQAERARLAGARKKMEMAQATTGSLHSAGALLATHRNLIDAWVRRITD